MYLQGKTRDSRVFPGVESTKGGRGKQRLGLKKHNMQTNCETTMKSKQYKGSSDETGVSPKSVKREKQVSGGEGGKKLKKRLKNWAIKCFCGEKARRPSFEKKKEKNTNVEETIAAGTNAGSKEKENRSGGRTSSEGTTKKRQRGDGAYH